MSPADPTPQNRKDLRPQPVSDPLHVVYWRFGARKITFACCNQIVSIFDSLFPFQRTRNLKDSVTPSPQADFGGEAVAQSLARVSAKNSCHPHPKFR